MGYHRAGFEVVGVDIKSQPRYPFEFHQADALAYPLDGFDVVHASPPCQAYTDLQRQSKREYPDLVALTRQRVSACSLWVIENVPEAPLLEPVILCGTMFPWLRVIRHRGFESSALLTVPSHGLHPLVYTMDKRKSHYGRLDEMTAFVQVTGGGNCSKAAAADAMGIDWMIKTEMNEAIPPAYTEFIGLQLMAALTHA